MKICTTFLASLALTFVLSWQAAAEERCASPDNIKSVSGAAHCLQIETHRPPGGATKTLAVVLHGDLSRGADADYIRPVAESAAAHGAIGVAMARPGYALDGRTSTGVATRDQGHWYKYRAEEIDSIAAAVAALQKHHKAERVVMVGHSGGAVVSGVMLGRAAPLVDAVILVACPCDVKKWRWLRDWKPLVNAESPIDYLSGVPKSSKIFAVTGGDDRNTVPVLARDYVKKAKELGLDATFFEVEGARHGFRRLGQSDGFDSALKQAINPG